MISPIDSVRSAETPLRSTTTSPAPSLKFTTIGRPVSGAVARMLPVRLIARVAGRAASRACQTSIGPGTPSTGSIIDICSGSPPGSPRKTR